MVRYFRRINMVARAPPVVSSVSLRSRSFWLPCPPAYGGLRPVRAPPRASSAPPRGPPSRSARAVLFLGGRAGARPPASSCVWFAPRLVAWPPGCAGRRVLLRPPRTCPPLGRARPSSSPPPAPASRRRLRAWGPSPPCSVWPARGRARGGARPARRGAPSPPGFRAGPRRRVARPLGAGLRRGPVVGGCAGGAGAVGPFGPSLGASAPAPPSPARAGFGVGNSRASPLPGSALRDSGHSEDLGACRGKCEAIAMNKYAPVQPNYP